MQGTASLAHPNHNKTIIQFGGGSCHANNLKETIKNNSADARQLDYSAAVLLRRGLQVVDLPQFSSDVSVCLLPR
jgi:hypothetical protein